MNKLARSARFFLDYCEAWLEVNSEKSRNFLKKLFKRKSCLLALALAFASNADAAQFEADKAKSSVKFEATQNGAPAMGEFKDFSANIDFDPAKPETSSVSAEVRMASLSANYKDLVSTLEAPEWFDSLKYPTAKFVSSRFIKIKDDEYQADGELTIRDITAPASFKFMLKEFDAKHAVIDGTTVISRNKFGVGQGEWKDTGAVKDEVKITLHIEAKAK